MVVRTFVGAASLTRPFSSPPPQTPLPSALSPSAGHPRVEPAVNLPRVGNSAAISTSGTTQPPHPPKHPQPLILRSPPSSYRFPEHWTDQGHRLESGTSRSLLGFWRARQSRVVQANTLAQIATSSHSLRTRAYIGKAECVSKDWEITARLPILSSGPSTSGDRHGRHLAGLLTQPGDLSQYDSFNERSRQNNNNQPTSSRICAPNPLSHANQLPVNKASHTKQYLCFHIVHLRLGLSCVQFRDSSLGSLPG